MTPVALSRCLATAWWVKERMAGLSETAMGVFTTSMPQKMTLGKRRVWCNFLEGEHQTFQ